MVAGHGCIRRDTAHLSRLSAALRKAGQPSTPPDTATCTAHSGGDEAEPLAHEPSDAAEPAWTDTEETPTKQFGEGRDPPAGCSGLVAGSDAEALLRVAQVLEGFGAGGSSPAGL